MSTKPWAIAGGGIAGLASALALAKAGKSVNVFEKAKEFAPIGAGLQLGPNAVRSLQKLGVWDRVAPHCTSPEAIVIRDGLTGKQLQKILLAANFTQKFGAPYRVIMRADLHHALLNACKNHPAIEINMGSEWGGVLSHVEGLLAADGIWSLLRTQHFPNARAIVLPHAIHRSLIPLPSTVEVNAVTLWLYPHGHVVHYAVGNPRKLNVVCVTKSSAIANHWANETKSDFIAFHFNQACDELRHSLSLSENWLSWPAAFVPPLETWVHDNLLLIGDAAHGTVPYLAQGAAMALEDAATLLNLAPQSLSVKDQFQKFMGLRQARNLQQHQTAISTANIYHASGFARLGRNALLQNMPASIFLQRIAWLYNGGPT